jgi:dienelactone hydrolase
MRRELLAAFAVLIAAPAEAYTSSAVTFASITDGKELPATLLKPDGAGRFPAVVIMHDCSGLGARSSGSPSRWGNIVANEGYVVLIADSFTPRGLPEGVCLGNLTPQQRDTVGPFARTADAYAAIGYLRKLDFVDGKHIGVMGGSHGGSTTMVAMFEPPGPGSPFVREKRNGFAAGIALYPDCGNRYGAWVPSRRSGNVGPVTGYSGVYHPIAPLLILTGEKDDWTPAASCHALADRARDAGYPVSLKIYPGAYHAFDSNAPVRYVDARNNINKVEGKGATTGGDPSAWADAIKQAKAFFGEHLARH